VADPPVWLNELNSYDGGGNARRSSTEYVCRSGAVLGNVSSTLYDRPGAKGNEFMFWGRSNPAFTCPDTETGWAAVLDSWSFDKYDGPIAVCLYSASKCI